MTQRKRSIKSLAALTAFSALTLVSQNTLASDPHEAFESDLRSIFQLIETNYGPLTLKKDSIGLDWEATKKAYIDRVQTIQSSEEFYPLVSDMFYGLNDAHVHIEIPSSFVRELPVQFKAVGDKIILNWKDSRAIEAGLGMCEAAIGDELVTLNGKTLEEIQSSRAFYNSDGNPLTNRAIFALRLSKQSESSGVLFSKDRVEKIATLRLKAADGSPRTCILPYKESGLPIIGHSLDPKEAEKQAQNPEETDAVKLVRELAPGATETQVHLAARKLTQVGSLFKKAHSVFNATANFADLKDSLSPENAKFQIGHEGYSFPLPKSFKKLKIKTKVHGMSAGVFEWNDKKVGVLRIPSYGGGESESAFAFLPFALKELVLQLQEETDLLLIDQADNPGGMVVLSDILVRNLNGKLDSDAHMKFRVKPTQGFLSEYLSLYALMLQRSPDGKGDNFADLLTDEELADFQERLSGEFKKVYSAFARGDSLSEPVSLSVISELIEIEASRSMSKLFFMPFLYPKKVRQHLEDKTEGYGKPIYMLINELCFSGGDATPALIQDYGIGKLIGTRTAGAGGTVEEFKSFVMNPFEFSLTTSLMYRSGGRYVENYGVHPDLPFALTVEDYREGFTNVLPRLMKTIESQ